MSYELYFGRWSLASMLGRQVHWSRKAHGNGNASDCLCTVGDCTPGLLWKKLDVSLTYLVSLVSMVIWLPPGGCACELVFQVKPDEALKAAREAVVPLTKS